MKNFIFATIVAFYFVCLGCSKTDKSEPAPGTTVSSDISTGLETTYNNNGEIQLRGNCDNCTTCCCTLTVVGPANATPNVGFCSSVFPGCGFPDCGCPIGDGTCGSGAGSGSDGEDADLQVGVTGEDFKEWCAGDATVPFVITNNAGITIFYEIDCGNGVDTFSLTTSQSIILTKDQSCDVSLGCRYF